MAEKVYTFRLKKLAKKSGGDRYTCADGDWDVYFPQAISRQTGIAAKELYVRVTTTKGE